VPAKSQSTVDENGCLPEALRADAPTILDLVLHWLRGMALELAPRIGRVPGWRLCPPTIPTGRDLTRRVLLHGSDGGSETLLDNVGIPRAQLTSYFRRVAGDGRAAQRAALFIFAKSAVRYKCPRSYEPAIYLTN
jgi:hypothetical protein